MNLRYYDYMIYIQDIQENVYEYLKINLIGMKVNIKSPLLRGVMLLERGLQYINNL